MAFKVLQVDHIGIGVNDLAATKEFYKNALGIEHLPEDEIVEEQKVKVSFFPCGDAELEFLETTTPDGPIGKFIEKNEKWFIVGFIILSTVVMALIGQPATLLVLAGALNGLILPITLGVCLIASKKKTIMGEDYHHPTWLLILGIVVVVISAYLGITSLGNLATLFA